MQKDQYYLYCMQFALGHTYVGICTTDTSFIFTFFVCTEPRRQPLARLVTSSCYAPPTRTLYVCIVRGLSQTSSVALALGSPII